MSHICKGWWRPEHAPYLQRLRRSPSPLGLSIAQQHTQLVEQSAATALSGMGRIEQETCCIREMVEATTAETRSIRGEVDSHVATLVAVADASVARTTEDILSHVKEVVEYSDVQALCVAADVTQRLESEIVAAMTSTAATAEVTMRTVVEGVRRDIQAQIEQNHADALRREQEAQHKVEDISKQLQIFDRSIK